MSGVRVWVCYETIGNDFPEDLADLERVFKEAGVHRRMAKSGRFVVLKCEGVTIDVSHGKVLDPSQMDIPYSEEFIKDDKLQIDAYQPGQHAPDSEPEAK